jgi:hypothetical protein
MILGIALGIVGLSLLLVEISDRPSTISGSKVHRVVGGQTCNYTAQPTGQYDCLGGCLNNPVYTNTGGGSGEQATLKSCGTCGGYYSGKVSCPPPG